MPASGGDLHYEITVNQESIPVSTLGHHVPDPEWRHEDSNGHTHTFVGKELPTLARVVVGHYWCDSCRDNHEVIEMRCVVCDEVVEPHWNFTGPRTEYVRGLTEAWLIVEGGGRYIVSPEEIEALIQGGPTAVRAFIERQPQS